MCSGVFLWKLRNELTTRIMPLILQIIVNDPKKELQEEYTALHQETALWLQGLLSKVVRLLTVYNMDAKRHRCFDYSVCKGVLDNSLLDHLRVSVFKVLKFIQNHVLQRPDFGESHRIVSAEELTCGVMKGALPL